MATSNIDTTDHSRQTKTASGINVALGAWLLAAPWLLSGASTSAKAGSVAVGAAIVLLSLPRGHRSREHYGNWDRFVL